MKENGKPLSHHHQTPFTVSPLAHGGRSTKGAVQTQEDVDLPPLESLLPASYRGHHKDLELSSMSMDYLNAELGMHQLEGFNKWFWLLSSPCLPSPLHDCSFLGRHIYITESMDRHLGLGKSNQLYLKPVPRILLDLRFWRDFLICRDGCPCSGPASGPASPRAFSLAPADEEVTKCDRQQLWECALGFLFSYAALVSHESDYHIARDKKLIPAEVTWEGWRTLAQEVVSFPDVRDRIHRRFLYGELRLHRLKEMSRLRHGALLPVIVGRLDLFARFFQSNVRWLASLVAFIAIFLSALQVGLATDALIGDETFQAFAHGFTLFALIGPITVLVGFALYFGCGVSYYLVLNLVAAKHGDKIRQRRRRWIENV